MGALAGRSGGIRATEAGDEPGDLAADETWRVRVLASAGESGIRVINRSKIARHGGCLTSVSVVHYNLSYEQDGACACCRQVDSAPG